jgi:hypothetical protein
LVGVGLNDAHSARKQVGLHHNRCAGPASSLMVAPPHWRWRAQHQLPAAAANAAGGLLTAGQAPERLHACGGS